MVEVIIAIFLRGNDKAIVVQESKVICNTYIGLIHFVVYGLKLLSGSIYKENIEIVLMPIERLDT